MNQRRKLLCKIKKIHKKYSDLNAKENDTKRFI